MMRLTYVEQFLPGVSWLEYPSHISNAKERDELLEWIENNCAGRYQITISHVCLKSKEDALAFKLRWQ